jgi:hypothetical protein
LWDERVGALRAPARLAYALASALRRREVPLSDAPRPRLGFAFHSAAVTPIS